MLLLLVVEFALSLSLNPFASPSSASSMPSPVASDDDRSDLREEDEENDDNGDEEEVEDAGEEEDLCMSDGVGEDDDDDPDFEEIILEALEDSAVVRDCSWSVPSVIRKESLLAAQREDLQKVMDLLSLSKHNARTLLIHYRWDVVRIFELLDHEGRHWLFSEAGVSIAEKSKHYALSSSSVGSITCTVCFEKIPPSGVTEMNCGHSYCNKCWTEYFIIKIKEGESKRITCMTPKCKAICDEDVVRNLVGASHRDIVDRFDRFLLESYIEDNDTVKWCPSVPHCGNAIHVKGDINCEVECICGQQFCFSCLAEAHSPCSCLMWELWFKKCHNESAAVDWMTVNTKPCPKCQKPVQKDGGCNLVICICRQSFCWVCGNSTGRQHTWLTISGHGCGRFGEDAKKRMQLGRTELYRYMHYYNRYKAHTESLKLERKLEKTIKGRISNVGIEDDSWITKGLNTLLRSRCILSYSYPFAYFMFGEELFKDELNPRERQIKQNLFEDQQAQLESNIERLSSFLEKGVYDFSNDKIMEMRINVLTLSSVVDGLCKKIYEYIENDLLGSLQGNHNISPYKSKGPVRAS